MKHSPVAGLSQGCYHALGRVNMALFHVDWSWFQWIAFIEFSWIDDAYV